MDLLATIALSEFSKVTAGTYNFVFLTVKIVASFLE